MRKRSRNRERGLIRRAMLISGVMALALAACGAALAEEASRLSLEQAIGIALRQSPSVGQGLSRVASSRISLGQAKADLLPSLSAGVSAGEQYSRSRADGGEGLDGEGDGLGHYEGHGSASAGVSSGLTLFNGFSNINSIRSASRDVAASEATYERTRQTVVFTIVQDYLAVLENGELVKSQRDNLEAQRQQLALVEEFHAAGKRSIADVLQQQATVAQAELSLLSAEQAESLSKLQLTSDMGLAPTPDCTLTPVEASAQAPYPITLTKEEILRAALAERLDLAAERNRLSAASVGVSAARSGWWPSLSLSGGASSSLLNRAYEDEIGYSVGLSLSIPIFDRLRTSASVKQAKLALSDEQVALDDLERTVALEVERALLDYDTARKRHEVAKAQLDYATEALKATTARYEVGASTLVEVTASNAQYVSARNDLVRAGYQLLSGRVAVSYHSGDVGEMADLLGFSLEGGSGE